MAPLRRDVYQTPMARDPDKAKDGGPPEVLDLLKAELRHRGMSDAEIEGVLRKRKRRSVMTLAVRPTPATRPTHPHPAPRLAEELCTVDFAARQLKLHPKTVLRFIHEGRLPATRVGKSYRILRADLAALAGLPAPAEPPASLASVTSIVDIPGVGPDLARAWAKTVTAATDAKPRNGVSLRAEVIYDPDRSHLKIVVVGGAADTVNLLSLIQVWLDQLTA
jgi:excisionase family DNA binding protein